MNIKNDRRTCRLPDYNYAQSGMYFITICTYQWQQIFGHIHQDSMQLSQLGSAVFAAWHDISKHFSHVQLDEFVIMPNHIHGIVVITDGKELDSECIRGTSNTIGSVVRCLKSQVTRWARKNNISYEIWQRNYYEHVVRNDWDYLRIAEYIIQNPLKWAIDKLNPSRTNGA